MAKHPIFKSVVRQATLELLQVTQITHKKISDDTGLSPTWIGMFANKKLKHTDIGRVETLYNYLSDTPLKV